MLLLKRTCIRVIPQRTIRPNTFLTHVFIYLDWIVGAFRVLDEPLNQLGVVFEFGVGGKGLGEGCEQGDVFAVPCAACFAHEGEVAVPEKKGLLRAGLESLQILVKPAMEVMQEVVQVDVGG